LAQEANPYYEAGQNISVRERPRSDYEAVGARWGAIFFYPQLEIGADWTDNALASDTNPQSDTIIRINPRLQVISDWPRHQIVLNFDLDRNQYARLTEESSTDLKADLNGRVDISHSLTVTPRVSFGLLTEPRTSETIDVDLAKPVRYDTVQASTSVRREVGRVRLSTDLNYARLNYHDALSVDGDVVDQNYRDNRRWVWNGRADYALAPSFRLFATLSGNIRRFAPAEFDIFTQDSQGWRVGGGAGVDLTHLIRGEFQAQYLHQSYRSPLFGSVSGPSFSGKLEWFATPLMTVTGTAERALEDSAQLGESGYLLSSFGLQIDHEPLRNLILTARMRADFADFNGVDRRDKLVTAEARATFLLSRSLGTGLSMQHITRSSSGADAVSGFDVNVVSLSLILQR
jgi:hypothetical protein